jgi:hypothetical protein
LSIRDFYLPFWNTLLGAEPPQIIEQRKTPSASENKEVKVDLYHAVLSSRWWF